MGVYFTSDLHLGHKAIPKYRDKFKSLEEHDNYVFGLIEKLNKRDILFIVGDFLFDGDHYNEYIEKLSKAECRIKLIMGNHDSLELYKEDCIEIQLPLFSYKSMWVSHCPIHTGEMRNRKGCIHGHLHMQKVMKEEEPDERYFNVNLDVNDYQFVKLENIKDFFNTKENT